jgi:hypothetical protein
VQGRRQLCAHVHSCCSLPTHTPERQDVNNHGERVQRQGVERLY